MRGERLAGQETDFGKSEREMRRALGRKVLVSEAAQREAELREVQIADFKEIYPESKLKADKRYLMRAESYMALFTIRRPCTCSMNWRSLS